MAPVQGRTSSYVSMENGEAFFGRWQLWHCFCRIGATSFVNVTFGMLAIWPKTEVTVKKATPEAQNSFPIFPVLNRFHTAPTSVPFFEWRVA